MDDTLHTLPKTIKGDGLILYCDGSTKPSNPGFSGYGVHGYSYTHDKTKFTVPKYTITNKGYLDSKYYKDTLAKKEQDAKEVNPNQYVDIVGSVNQPITNNLTELLAFNKALEISKLSDVKDILIMSDSEYVVKGINEWCPIWIRNNWRKPTGGEVSNKYTWLKTLDNYNQLLSKDFNIHVKWVKGHTDELEDHFTILGNVQADKLANIGSEKSKKNINEITVDIEDPKSYWKSTESLHPLLTHKTCYITNTSNKLENFYFIGHHGKLDEFLGRSNPDGCLAVVYLKEKNKAIDFIKQYVYDEGSDINRISYLRLNALYSHKRIEDFIKYGDHVLMRKNNKLDLTFVDKEPILKEIYPPRLALNVFIELDTLYHLLENYRSDKLDKEKYITTDLTDIFYKNNKNKLQLKPEFKVGLASIKLKINIPKTDKQQEITYNLGIDSPDRNSLKKLETLNPKLTAITFLESPYCIRYYTVIELNDGSYGIWGGVYSNRFYLN